MTGKAVGARAYVSAVRDLREAARWNREDTEFAESGRIVYILDANILVHFLRGGSGRDGSAGVFSFRGLLDDQEAARVNDRLTTEFLLSNALPGQRGDPVLMAGKHWNETLNRATAIAREINNQKQAGQITPTGLAKLGQIEDPGERLRAAEGLVPRRILEALKTAAAMRRRLEKAFVGGESRVKPLDQTRYWSTTDLDRIRDEDVRNWRNALTKSLRQPTPAAQSGKAVRHASGNAIGRGSHNVANDVQVLASIESLYRVHPEACNDRRKLLFLLVTADHGVLQAVRMREPELAKEGIPNFVRHPRVFSPILNFSSMAKARLRTLAVDQELRSVFERVETSLDLLLNARRRQEGSWNVVSLTEDWAQAARRLAALNLGFFGDDSEDLRIAADLLVEEDGVLKGARMLRDTIDEIGSEHSRLLAIGALRDLASRVTSATAARIGGFARRAPLQIIGVDLFAPVRHVLPATLQGGERLIGGLKALLDHIEDGKQSELIEKIGTALQEKWQEPASQLLAACIYLAVDSYQAGRECALRAAEWAGSLGLKGPLRREAEYCAALATRLSLRTRDEYQNASNALLRNVVDRSRGGNLADRIASLRDSSERAALMQTACLLQRLEPDPDNAEPIFPAQQLATTFDEALDLIEATSEDLEGFETSDDDAFWPVVSRVRLQLCINKVGGLNDRQLFGDEISHPPFRPDELRKALVALESAIEELPEGRAPTVAYVNRAIARVILYGHAEIASAISILERAQTSAASTEMDRREYELLRAKLPKIAERAEVAPSSGAPVVAQAI